MSKMRFFFSTSKGKIYLSVFITIIIMTVIFLPIFFLVDFGNNWITAYNRDSNSGTRESFERTINFDSEKQSFSENVLEVNSNDSMVDKVRKDSNSIGYVSAFSVYDYNEDVPLYDDLVILSLNGVNPTEVGNEPGDVPLDQYDGRRQYNIFFRVEQIDAEFIFDNMFFNASNNNIWAPNGEWDTTNLNPDGFIANMSVENQLGFVYSFAFFNWVLFSSDTENILAFGVNDDYDTVPDFTDLALDNYFKNNYDLLFNNNGEIVTIYTQGSTSVASIVNELFYEPEFGFFTTLNNVTSNYLNYDIQLEYQEAFVGSGDAFGNDVSGQHTWLSFQSRDLDASEAESFGYIGITEEDIELQAGEFYPTIDSYNENWIPYFSFESDLLIFITNNETTYTNENGEEVAPTNIDTLGLNLIYTQAFNWEDLYGLGLVY